MTFDRGQLVFGYNGTTGTLNSITAPGSNTLSFTYDGSLPTGVTWAGAVAGSVGVSYNTDLRVSTQTVNGANSVSFGYDNDGLLTLAGALGLKRHGQHGFLERDSVGSMLGVWGYDPKGALGSYAASYSGNALFQTGYVRDSLDRITQLTETVQGSTTTRAFTYDSAGRLATVTENSVLVRTYGYDLNGNRLSLTGPGLSVSGTYDAQDRLLSYGTTTYGYTSNGELKRKVVGTDTTRYTYDALGNLVQVVLPGGPTIDYVIDGQSRRVGKKVNGVLQKGWLWQSQLAPVAELDGAGALVSRFVYATRVNVPDYMIKAGVTFRLVLDHLGSVRLVVNTANGTVAQRIDYDEFGRVTRNTNPGFQPFGFGGGLYDEQTGLVRFGRRDYDAITGRWTAKDPLGFGGGVANLYAYVSNDPVNLVDPSGEILPLLPVILAGAGIGALVNVAFTVGAALLSGSDLSVRQVLGAAASGAVAGGLGALTGPAGGSLARALGSKASSLLAKGITSLLSGGAGALGQAMANAIDPCNASSVLNAALFAGLGGAASTRFPSQGFTTLQQAAHFAPGLGGLLGTQNARGIAGGFLTAAGVGGGSVFGVPF